VEGTEVTDLKNGTEATDLNNGTEVRDLKNGTEVTDLKNGATEITKETEKKNIVFFVSSAGFVAPF
jgi:hypothetical protein